MSVLTMVRYSQFFYPMVSSIQTTAGGNVKKYWAGVENLQDKLFRSREYL